MDSFKKSITYDAVLDKQMIALSNYEQSIFFTSLFFLQYDKDIIIDFPSFTNILGKRYRSKGYLELNFKNILKKINHTKTKDIDNLPYLNIFDVLKVTDDGKIHMKLNTDFYFLFDNLYNKPTKKIFLETLFAMDDKYKKTLYRIVIGYDNIDSGWFRITEDELFTLMCFPASYEFKKKNYYTKKSIKYISNYVKLTYEIKRNIFGNKYYHFKIS